MEALFGFLGFLAGAACGLLSVLIGGHMYSRVNGLRSPITGRQVQPQDVALPFIARTDADEARLERELAAEADELEQAKAYHDSVSGLGRNG